MPSAHYQRHKQSILKFQAKYVERNRQHLWDVLREAECADCGLRDPLVIEFDHPNGDKKQGVSFMVTRGYALETLQKEIAKCVVIATQSVHI